MTRRRAGLTRDPIVQRWISTLVLTLSFCTACVHPHTGRDRDGPMFTFGVVADVQYCDCDARGSRYYRASLDKLAHAVEVFNREEPDFVVQLGDLIDRDAASYGDVLPVLRRLEAPAYHVLGNHDFSIGEAVRGGVRQEVAKVLGMERAYYDFRHGGWRFVVLDGNDVSLHATAEGEARRRAEETLASLRERGAVHAQVWNGGLGADQLAWLGRTLADADARGERVVLFGHYPLFPDDAHNLWNAEAVVALLEAHPSVAAYISGHNHAGSYAVRGGIHFLTLRGLVETPDTSAFALIEVTPEGLRVRGWGREPDRILPFRAPAP